VVVGTVSVMGKERKYLGDYGEALARRAYEQAGYEVLAQNWRGRAGEIDLVLARDGCVVVCEVKTRATERYGVPAEAVDWRKQRRLRTLAVEFLAERKPSCRTVRFDVVSIVSGRLQIIEEAF
jgi:putative endonuclease